MRRYRHLELKEIRLDKEASIRMIQIGFPAGLQSMLFSISNVLVQSSVNSFGASVVAANTAASNICLLYTSLELFAQVHDMYHDGVVRRGHVFFVPHALIDLRDRNDASPMVGQKLQNRVFRLRQL